MTDAKISIRPDPRLLADLDTLLAAGAPTRAQAIRDAVHAAARTARGADLRAEADRLRNSPSDRAAVAAILADFDDDEFDDLDDGAVGDAR